MMAFDDNILLAECQMYGTTSVFYRGIIDTPSSGHAKNYSSLNGFQVPNLISLFKR